jgi:polyphosphate kinase
MDALKNGKQVTVVVELKARFDEDNNIAWSMRLE